MTIVFDARCIDAKASGTGVYVRELLRRLPLLAPDWNWYILFHDEDARRAVLADALPGGRPNVFSEILPYRFKSLFGKAKLAKRLIHIRCDLYFSPIVANSFLAMGGFTGACRAAVVAVHSNPMRDTVNPFWAAVKRQCLVRAVSYCAALLVVSRALREDIVRQLALSSKASARLKVIHGGVSTVFSPAPTVPPAGKARVILYVGNQRRYKNIVTLVRAFAELRRRFNDLHLVLVGPESDNPAPLRNLIHDLGLDRHVTLAGETIERDLVAAYREASMLVCPSGYEGFSFPLLEAMACGTPVVCCDGGAVRELVGDAAEPVPAGDVPALEAAMERVLTDEAFRAKSVAAGLARAAEFSWDRTARETLAAFTDVLAARGGEVP